MAQNLAFRLKSRWLLHAVIKSSRCFDCVTDCLSRPCHGVATATVLSHSRRRSVLRRQDRHNKPSRQDEVPDGRACFARIIQFIEPVILGSRLPSFSSGDCLSCALPPWCLPFWALLWPAAVPPAAAAVRARPKPTSSCRTARSAAAKRATAPPADKRQQSRPLRQDF
jgi:hypothetical protein